MLGYIGFLLLIQSIAGQYAGSPSSSNSIKESNPSLNVVNNPQIVYGGWTRVELPSNANPSSNYFSPSVPSSYNPSLTPITLPPAGPSVNYGIFPPNPPSSAPSNSPPSGNYGMLPPNPPPSVLPNPPPSDPSVNYGMLPPNPPPLVPSYPPQSISSVNYGIPLSNPPSSIPSIPISNYDISASTTISPLNPSTTKINKPVPLFDPDKLDNHNLGPTLPIFSINNNYAYPANSGQSNNYGNPPYSGSLNPQYGSNVVSVKTPSYNPFIGQPVPPSLEIYIGSNTLSPSQNDNKPIVKDPSNIIPVESAKLVAITTGSANLVTTPSSTQIIIPNTLPPSARTTVSSNNCNNLLSSDCRPGTIFPVRPGLAADSGSQIIIPTSIPSSSNLGVNNLDCNIFNSLDCRPGTISPFPPNNIKDNFVDSNKVSITNSGISSTTNFPNPVNFGTTTDIPKIIIPTKLPSLINTNSGNNLNDCNTVYTLDCRPGVIPSVIPGGLLSGVGSTSNKPDVNFFPDNSLSNPVIINPGGTLLGGLDGDSTNIPQVEFLDVICQKDSMQVQIRFDIPFNGIIYSKGYFDKGGCIYVQPNNNQNEFRFSIDNNSCGTISGNLNAKGSTYFENVLVFQHNSNFIDSFDTTKRIRCEWGSDVSNIVNFRPFSIDNFNVSTATFSNEKVTTRLEVQFGEGPFGAQVANQLVHVGDLLSLVIFVNSNSQGIDALVHDCIAHNGDKKKSISLIRNDGCSVNNKIITPFFTTSNTQNSNAALITYANFRAFQFPDSTNVNFACNLTICKNKCEKSCSSGDSIFKLPSSSGIGVVDTKITTPIFEATVGNDKTNVGTNPVFNTEKGSPIDNSLVINNQKFPSPLKDQNNFNSPFSPRTPRGPFYSNHFGPINPYSGYGGGNGGYGGGNGGYGGGSGGYGGGNGGYGSGNSGFGSGNSGYGGGNSGFGNINGGYGWANGGLAGGNGGIFGSGNIANGFLGNNFLKDFDFNSMMQPISLNDDNDIKGGPLRGLIKSHMHEKNPKIEKIRDKRSKKVKS